MRKAVHEAFSQDITEQLQNAQMLEALVLAGDMIRLPTEWDRHLRRSSASMVLGVTYNFPAIESEQDPRITRANNFIERLTHAALPGAHIVEFLPWLLYIPNR